MYRAVLYANVNVWESLSIYIRWEGSHAINLEIFGDKLFLNAKPSHNLGSTAPSDVSERKGVFNTSKWRKNTRNCPSPLLNEGTVSKRLKSSLFGKNSSH